MGEFHDDATADLQASVERRSALVSRTWRRLSLLLFGSLLTGPLVMCLGLGCLVFAPQPELDPDDNEPVTLVERDGLSCTGQMTVDGRLWFGGRPESGYWAPVLDADEADYAWVDPSTLIGRRVRVIGIRTMDGRFDRIVGSLDSGNFAIVVTDDSEEHTVSLAGLCPLD